MEKTDLTTILKDALVERNNPTDLKTIIIGVVRQVSPVIVGICENKILLEENDELLISEWFRFRCNIDKTLKLSNGVVSDLSDSDSDCNSAKGVTETHSYTGTPCNMPSAITYLASAISKTNSAITKTKNELLALKCTLKVGDYVAVGSLDQLDKYILLDKVLEDDYKFYDEV